MPPPVATVLCVLFILYLFWTDLRKPNGPSNALWIPLVWMFLAGSRWASSWLDLSVPLVSADDYAEGSPLDRAVFFSLIVAGIVVLSKREIAWKRLLADNKWIALYLIYCLASIAWTEEPFILFKRWIKDLGNPIMALIILTEKRPYEAFGTILRRLSYLFLPLSVLFVRYYPDLGRAFHHGTPMYTGVGHQKNDLGMMCLITGIYLFWTVVRKARGTLELGKAQSPLVALVLAVMLVWLLYMSNSQTSLTCLVMSVGIMILSRLPFVSMKPSRIVFLVALLSTMFVAVDGIFDIRAIILDLLGRDSTFTSRTHIWATLMEFESNPLVGAGFMSFWAGDRLEAIWRLSAQGINQAHNGYIEQYLNLGYIGVSFILAIMISGLNRVRKNFDASPDLSMLKFCFISTAVLYNFTEASFYGINNMWLLLLVGCISVTTPLASSVASSSRHLKPFGNSRQPAKS